MKVKDSKITVKIKQSATVWKKVKPVSYLFKTPMLKHIFGMFFSKVYFCEVYLLCEFIFIDINAYYKRRPPETCGRNAFIFCLLKILNNFLKKSR